MRWKGRCAVTVRVGEGHCSGPAHRAGRWLERRAQCVLMNREMHGGSAMMRRTEGPNGPGSRFRARASGRHDCAGAFRALVPDHAVRAPGVFRTGFHLSRGALAGMIPMAQGDKALRTVT